MKKDKVIVWIDPALKKGDFSSRTVFKISEDRSISIVDVQEINQSLFTSIKKSRKTKDTKSFNSAKYEIFKDGYFNCDRVPYGYNFLLGKCIEPATFEPKIKER